MLLLKNTVSFVLLRKFHKNCHVMKNYMLLVIFLFVTLSVFAQKEGDYPAIYHFTNAEFDTYANKYFYKLDVDKFFTKRKRQYYKITPDNYLKEKVFTLYETLEYLYLIDVLPQADIDYYMSKHGKTPSDWALSHEICRITKSKGYDEFFTNHIAKLKIDEEARNGIALTKSPIRLIYDVNKDELVLVDEFDGRKQYRGDDAESFIHSGILAFSMDERREIVAQKEIEDKEREQILRMTNNWPYLKSKNIIKHWDVYVFYDDRGQIVTDRMLSKQEWLYSKKMGTMVYCGPSESEITDVFVLPPTEDKMVDENKSHMTDGTIFKNRTNQWTNFNHTNDAKIIPPRLQCIDDLNNGWHTITVKFEDGFGEIYCHKSTLDTIDELLKSKANKTFVFHNVYEYRGVGTIGRNGYQPVK